MINFAQILVLGAIAGLTIFLGLPFALLKGTSQKVKGFLNAVAIGILFFLIIDVFSHAWDVTEESMVNWFNGNGGMQTPVINLSAALIGLAIGLLGLAYYESRLLQRVHLVSHDNGNGIRLHNIKPDEYQVYKLSMMIAIAIGAHNFSEGLAIGQSYAAGSIALAVVLVIGFGAHNATEGFGISGPLTNLESRPSLKFLTLLGLIGGLPTFIGTLVGSLLGVSSFTYILFLSLAGGALVYVSLLMYNSGRRQIGNYILMIGIFVGLCAGFLTDLLVTLGGV